MATARKIVGADPHPAAGYTFHQDEGPSMHFMGPVADQMKQWSDNTSRPDARIAGPYFAQPGAEHMSMAPARAPATPAPAPGGYAGPANFDPTASVAPAPAQAQGVDPNDLESLNTPAAKYARLHAPVHVAGTAAFDPEAVNAGRRPVAVSQTVTGALPGTPEEEKQRLESAQALHSANQAAIKELDAASAERVAVAEDRRTQALHSAIEADNDRRDALQKRAAVEDTWNTTNARLQKERDAIAEQKVDPNRLFHGAAGTLNRVMSAIAVGLGAFSSAITKNPNYAQQIVDANIQRDIDSQTDQIHRKGLAAQNALSDFQKTYGLTLDEARSAVKANQLRYAASMADMNAARIGSADARQQAAVLKADFLTKAAATEAELAEKVKGRVSTTSAMMSPKAATRGYDRPKTDKELKAGAEAGAAEDKYVFGGGKDSADRSADLQEHKHVVEYGEKRRDLLSADKDMKEYAASMGANVNPDGTLTTPKDDIPGTGITSHAPNILLSDKGRDVGRLRGRVVSSMLKALTGLGVTKVERDAMVEQVEGTWDEDAVKGLQQAMQVIRDHSQKLDASYGPDVVKTYQRQEGATDRMAAEKERAGATPEKL